MTSATNKPAINAIIILEPFAPVDTFQALYISAITQIIAGNDNAMKIKNPGLLNIKAGLASNSAVSGIVTNNPVSESNKYGARASVIVPSKSINLKFPNGSMENN